MLLRPIIAIFLVVILVFSLHATARIYQWKDETGKIHFTDKKPSTKNATGHQGINKKKNQQALKIIIFDKDRLFSFEEKSEIRQKIKNIYDAYTHFLNISPSNTVKIKIHTFKTQEQINTYCLENWPDQACKNPAQHFNDKQTIALVGSEDTKETIRDIIHESSHATISQITPHSLSWVTEGLALYFDGLKIAAGTPWVQPRNASQAWLKDQIKRNSSLTVREFINAPASQWHVNNHQENPKNSHSIWSIMFFLMSKDEGRSLVKTLLEKNIKNNQDLARLIKNYYPGGEASLEYDWYEWSKKPYTAQKL